MLVISSGDSENGKDSFTWDAHWFSGWSDAQIFPWNLKYYRYVPKKKFLAWPKLQFYSLKLSLASESPSTLFLRFRVSCKWSQMIHITQKHRDRHQKQVSRVFRTKVTISLCEVVLGLLQHLYPVLDLQINLRLVKMVPNDSSWPKNIGIDTKNKSVACSEPKLQFHSLNSSLAFYSPSTMFLTFGWIWGSWK